MINAILKLNRWYDDLDKDHGGLRLVIFFIPMLILICMMNLSSDETINFFGLFGMMTLLAIRLVPLIARPR